MCPPPHDFCGFFSRTPQKHLKINILSFLRFLSSELWEVLLKKLNYMFFKKLKKLMFINLWAGRGWQVNILKEL